jgi:hypothetical protein
MTGSLNHPPGKIIQQLLIDLGHGTVLSAAGATTGSWPVYYGTLPDSPDNAVCVFDTEPMQHGRDMVKRERCEHPGFQVLVRCDSIVDGYAKAQDIAIALDQDVYQRDVVLEGDTYSVQAITRTSGVLVVGLEIGSTRRRLYTVNATASLCMTDETGTAT